MEEVKKKLIKSTQEKFVSNEQMNIASLIKNGYNPDKPHPLLVFNGVSKCKSIWRAIRKQRASVDGSMYPKRPFNNRKPTKGRDMNEDKKRLYEQFKHFNKHVSDSKEV